MHTRRGRGRARLSGETMTYANDITTSDGIPPDAEGDEFDPADDEELGPDADDDDAEWDDEEEEQEAEE
jgi:hypothetical protein